MRTLPLIMSLLLSSAALAGEDGYGTGDAHDGDLVVNNNQTLVVNTYTTLAQPAAYTE